MLRCDVSMRYISTLHSAIMQLYKLSDSLSSMNHPYLEKKKRKTLFPLLLKILQGVIFFKILETGDGCEQTFWCNFCTISTASSFELWL